MKYQRLQCVKVAACAGILAAGLFAVACEDANNPSSDDQGNVGQKLSALSKLVGAKYILDIPSAQWTSPDGLGKEIAKAQTKYAFEVLDADVSALTITVLLATVGDGGQDTCNKTYTITGTLDADEMTFAIGPVDIQTYLIGPGSEVMSTCRNFTISGQIVEKGAVLVSGAMSAELDTREIYPLFYLSDWNSGEELCAAAASVNMPCNECAFEPDDAMCLDFVAEDFTVFDSPDLTLTEVAEFDDTCRE